MSDHRQADLFSSGPAAPVDTAPGAAGLVPLADALPGGIRLGTSSWTFPGWAGIVYDREASPGVLAAHGLAAYAGHPLLRCVGLDRTYYGPIPLSALRMYREQTPADFRFVAKADRRLVFPGGPGSDPELFLDPSWARDHVVAPLHEGLGDRLGAVLFQFPPVHAEALGGARPFAETIYRFLTALPPGPRYAVEIRTPALLTPDYAAALHHAGAGHGYVVHPEMPGLGHQAQVIPPAGPGPTVIRWMLRSDRSYEEAREAWAPFSALQAPDPPARESVAGLARAAAAAGSEALVVVNNKAEGSSPLSVEALARTLAGPAGATL